MVANELQGDKEQKVSAIVDADTTGTSNGTILFGIQDGGVNTTNPGCL